VRDRELGLGRRIGRRDFLNGVALTVGASLLGVHRALAFGLLDDAPERAPSYYPPALTGLRGSHAGSFEVAHSLRDGDFWERVGAPADTREAYDLVVVGGGLSGLAAAHYFRQHAGRKARILILDNHDDFGGHAKRNEFHDAGRTILGYGGTFAIDSAAPYSRVARDLVSALGVDVTRWERVYDKKLYAGLGMRPGVFFDRETFGADRLLASPGADPGGEAGASVASTITWEDFLAAAPLSELARRDLLRLYTDAADHLPHLSQADKKARLARQSYALYLTQTMGLHADVLPFLQARTHSLYGTGIDAVSAQDAWGLGLPGFKGMQLDPTAGPGMGRDAIPSDAPEYFFHFPDGNASLARLLVRGLLPAAVPGRTADDIVTARVDYGKLDDAAERARIRLNSTVVRVKHVGDPPRAREVEVAYVRGGRLQTVRAKQAVMACWNVVIPYLCPELPQEQKDALAYAVKVPIVYTNVLLRDLAPFQKLGIDRAHCPGSYHTSVNLDMPVSVGDYHSARTASDPVVVHMMRTPCSPRLAARSQHRAGRVELLDTTFETFERNIRDQLARMLGAGGFDPARDIRAITVNRWPHGYAYQYNSLWDPFWLEGKGPTPCETARKPFGRLAIANSDAGAYAYTDGAIDQAHRAVRELLRLS
jgi:spermidine dehydrogenase